MCYGDDRFEIKFYQLSNTRIPFNIWLDSLKDKKTQTRIATRINQLMQGHFGDCKSLGNGVWELRFHFGAGYRAYYSKIGNTIVLLLSGGDKASQTRDIKRAIEYLHDYQTRKQ